MKVAERIAQLITDNGINSSANDVRWFSGWDRSAHTAQYRFGVKEATALAAAISELSPRTQKALVRELDRRSTKGPFVGQISFISSAAASVMNKLSADLGIDNKFDVVSKKAPAPMG